MRTRATNGFTEAQVIAALAGRSRPTKFQIRYELLDVDNQLIREVTNIDLDGSEITHNTFSDVKRQARFKIREADVELDDYPTLVTDDDALFYLRLGETSGNADDSSGNGRTFTAAGGLTYSAPSLLANATENTGIVFNGTTGYFSIADAAWQDVTVATWEAWIKTSTATGIHSIIGRNDGGSNVAFNFRINTGLLELAANFGAGNVSHPSTANVADGLPHHVVATYDGARVKLYVDSVRVYSAAQTGNLANVTLGIYVGQRGGAGAQFWDGTLDEVAFYGRALSATEIREHYQAGSGDLAEIDFNRDRIKPYVALKMDSNGTDGTPWAEWPLGIFTLEAPTRNSDSASVSREVSGFDQSVILLNNRVTARYEVASGANVITAVSTALTAAGITTPSPQLTATSSTMPALRDWPIGTSYLRIINDLLESINYRGVHFDGDGAAVAEPYQLPSTRSSEYTFATDSNSVILDAGVVADDQIVNVPNVVVLVRENPDTATLTSTQTNSKVNSKTSTVNRGYNIVHYETVADAANQTDLDNLAKRRLTELSEVIRYITFKTTVLHPFLDDLDKITFQHQNVTGALDINADFIITEWRMPLSEIGDEQIRARQVVSVI